MDKVALNVKKRDSNQRFLLDFDQDHHYEYSKRQSKKEASKIKERKVHGY